MRGHLKTIILKMLDKKSMSGSEIINEIEILMNWKPSCGSIYPLLATIEEEGLTNSVQNKGKKIYTLTTDGKKTIQKKDEETEELFIAMEKSYKLLESVYGFDTTLEREMLEDMKSGVVPFQNIYEESKQIKDELSKLQRKNKLEKNITQVKKILQKCATDLKKISTQK
ncbi:MAG: PadR family transcriptional regulator [Candidatus Woesearchaeota archaeon]